MAPNKLINGFTIRVYGIMIKHNAVLISDEVYAGKQFTKFPGGGVQFGEGLAQALAREFMEELNASVQVQRHLYVNDDLVVSVFDPRFQLIAHYFAISGEVNVPIETQQIQSLDLNSYQDQKARWLPLSALNSTLFTFPIDQRVASLIPIWMENGWL